MAPQNEIEIELSQSAYCLRLAAQILKCHGSTEVAAYLTEQADKNQSLLLPLVQR
jgi:hypothetical protein